MTFTRASRESNQPHQPSLWVTLRHRRNLTAWGAGQKGITQKGITQKGINQKGINQKGINQKGITQKGINQKGIRIESKKYGVVGADIRLIDNHFVNSFIIGVVGYIAQTIINIYENPNE